LENHDDALKPIPSDVSISSPSRPVARLRGSHSSRAPFPPPVALRKKDTDDDFPGPDDDPLPPPPPPPPVSAPDMALQLNVCLPPDQNTAIVDAVRAALDPNADVRTICRNGSQRIGIWLRPAVSTTDNEARDRGLQAVNILGAGEQLTFFINAALVRRNAAASFDKQPKRLNGDGVADEDGPVHLNGLRVDFKSPNQILSVIDGFDERPWPDVDFTYTITDTLTVSGGRVNVTTSNDIDVDSSWINFLTGLFLFVFPPLGVVFLVERIIIAAADTPQFGSGAGASAAQLIPAEILIPGGLKVVASYSRIEVSQGGIFAGGTFDVVGRVPEVSISGPAQISVVEGATSVARSYSIRTDDLRPPLSVHWSGEGIANPSTAETTNFRFSLGNAQVGQVTKRISVQVTDADGLTASADRMVSIFVTPADDDDFPPACKAKPWLPQCQESLARARKARERTPR
jgi:hypothetical protein